MLEVSCKEEKKILVINVFSCNKITRTFVVVISSTNLQLHIHDSVQCIMGYTRDPLILAKSLCLIIDDTAKGGLTQFWELFTVIPWAPKDLKGQ